MIWRISAIQGADPTAAEHYLAHLLELPLLKRETQSMREEAVRTVAAAMPEHTRREAVFRLGSIRDMQPEDILRSPGRPGILADFADMHPWMWWKVEGSTGVQFTNVAHHPLKAAGYYVWLRHEIGGRGIWEAKVLMKRRSLALIQPLRGRTPNAVLDQFKDEPNPFFTPPGNAKMSSGEGARLICTYLDKNQSRHLQAIRTKREKFSVGSWRPYIPHAVFGSGWERLFQTHEPTMIS